MIKRTSLQLAALLAFALTACVTPPRVQTGPNAEVSHDGLVRLDNTRMKRELRVTLRYPSVESALRGAAPERPLKRPASA